MQHYWLVGHQPRGRGLVLLLSLRGVVSHPKPFHNIHSLNVIFPHFVLFLQNHPEKKLFFFLWYKKYTQIGVSFTFFPYPHFSNPKVDEPVVCLYIYISHRYVWKMKLNEKKYIVEYISTFFVYFLRCLGVSDCGREESLGFLALIQFRLDISVKTWFFVRYLLKSQTWGILFRSFS